MSEIAETDEVKIEKFVDTEDMRFLNVKVSWKKKTKPASEMKAIIEKSFNEQGYIFQRLEDERFHAYWQIMVGREELKNQNHSHNIISDIIDVINFSPVTERVFRLKITSSDYAYIVYKSGCF